MRAGQIFALAICAAITLGFTVTALWCLFTPGLWIATIIFLPFIAVMAWLTLIAWRGYRGIPDPELLQPEGDSLVWRGSRARAWGSFLAAGLFAAMVAGLLLVSASVLAADDFAAGEKLAVLIIFIMLALVLVALTQLVWRNARGFHGARIELAPEVLHLELPRWRSLIHRLPPVRASHAWGQIAAIETRHEAYSSQGMAMLQRPYWLVLRGGERIFLFEDRGIGSPQETRSLDPVASAIAERAGAEWRELPLAEGRGGILGAWGTAPPMPGSAPPTTARTEVLERRLRFTGRVALYAFALAMGARAIGWMLQ